REAVHVFGNVLVWNLRLEVAALEAQNDGLVYGCALSEVMVRIGRRHRSPLTLLPRNPHRAPSRRTLGVPQIEVSKLVRRLPDVGVYVNNHKITVRLAAVPVSAC